MYLVAISIIYEETALVVGNGRLLQQCIYYLNIVPLFTSFDKVEKVLVAYDFHVLLCECNSFL